MVRLLVGDIGKRVNLSLLETEKDVNEIKDFQIKAVNLKYVPKLNNLVETNSKIKLVKTKKNEV